MSNGNECRCGRPTRDTATVCDNCLDELTRDLNEMPWVQDQIAISITRQRSAASGGSRSAETGLPFNEKASDVQRALHSTLATWVRFCDEEHVRASDPSGARPSDTLASMARWLLWRVDGLGHHELGSDAVDEITSAVADVRRVVFAKAAPKVYLGTCREDVNGVQCDHAIYAKEGDLTGRCSSADCRAEYDVKESRALLEVALDSRLVTAAEVATIAVHLGLEQPRERVRKRVNQWAARERITAKGTADDGSPRFVYSEVRALLYAEFATREEAS